MTTIGAVGMYRVAGLLVSVHGIDALRALPVGPSRVRLHPVPVPHPWGWWSSANRSAIAMTVRIAIATILSLGKVAGIGVAVLVIVASAIVATPSAAMVRVVDAHRLRPTPVFAINGGFERADRVERALPSRTSGVGEIRIDCRPFC